MSVFSHSQPPIQEKANCPHANIKGALIPIPIECGLRAVVEMVDVLGKDAVEDPSLLSGALADGVEPKDIFGLKSRLDLITRNHFPLGKREESSITEINEVILGASIEHAHKRAHVRATLKTAAGNLIEVAQATNDGPVARTKRHLPFHR